MELPVVERRFDMLGLGTKVSLWPFSGNWLCFTVVAWGCAALTGRARRVYRRRARKCSRCGYCLDGLATRRCPECGV